MITIIAKTETGNEFMYSREYSYQVSKSRAAQICSMLNRSHWQLSGNDQKWFVYEVDKLTFETLYASFQKLVYRNGRLFLYK